MRLTYTLDLHKFFCKSKNIILFPDQNYGIILVHKQNQVIKATRCAHNFTAHTFEFSSLRQTILYIFITYLHKYVYLCKYKKKTGASLT